LEISRNGLERVETGLNGMQKGLKPVGTGWDGQERIGTGYIGWNGLSSCLIMFSLDWERILAVSAWSLLLLPRPTAGGGSTLYTCNNSTMLRLLKRGRYRRCTLYMLCLI